MNEQNENPDVSQNVEVLHEIGFGSVVDRLFPGNDDGELPKAPERSVVVGLPDGDALNVSSVITLEDGTEALKSGGSASLEVLIPVNAESWSAQRIAQATADGMGLGGNTELVASLTTQLQAEEASKPKIELPLAS